MREVRRRFHEELRALEGEVQRTGTQAQRLLEQALQALTRRDLAVCEAVIRGDDEVDQLYLDIEDGSLACSRSRAQSRPTCGC
jgi:phosphate uptake regulator